jgi:hypothetical protein
LLTLFDEPKQRGNRKLLFDLGGSRTNPVDIDAAESLKHAFPGFGADAADLA